MVEMRGAGDGEIARWLRVRVGAGAHLRSDSRAVRGGDAFAAFPGVRGDGRAFAADACARGAGAILVEERDWAGGVALEAPVLAVEDLHGRIGPIASAFYGDPGAQLRTIAITGTNGKTSSCQWVAAALNAAGMRCAAFGTLGCGFPGAPLPGSEGLTTPQACDLQRMAREVCDAGGQALAMEASSIGLAQGRVRGMPLEVALFTNLTRDHLDYHGDMERYAAAKRLLFDTPGLRHAVVNIDDEFGRAMVMSLAPGRALRALALTATSASGTDAALPPGVSFLGAQGIEYHAGATRFTAERREAPATAPGEGGAITERALVEVPLLGSFNVANLLGVLGVLGALGIGLAQAARLASGLRAPAGRLQPIGEGRGCVLPVVDYAHTPDAIAQALRALRPVAQARGGRLVIVFGAGGDRDRGKRPLMAEAASRGADAIVLTSDNPRSESPAAILADIAAGLAAGIACRQEPDRAEAIALALANADAGDVVLIAGKGHEDYQETDGVRTPFSDAGVAGQFLRSRGLPWQ
jgi:UDP-N-acetylmuramyl-tripeptide synthetase